MLASLKQGERRREDGNTGWRWSLLPVPPPQAVGARPFSGKGNWDVDGLLAHAGGPSLTRNTCASKAWIESDTFENKSAAEIRLSSLS